MTGSKQDAKICREITRRYSKSFYWAFRSLPRSKADAVWAIYAFCRKLDDAVDEQAGRGFATITDKWECFCAGHTPDEPEWRALRQAFNRFGCRREPYDGMIAGQRLDLHFTQPVDDEALLAYCSLVAGTVGSMLLPVLASKNAERLQEPAVQLGQAMQLTNILRDAGEDFKRGRVYFSRQTMSAHSVDVTQLGAGIVDGPFIALWEHYAALAEELYDQAAELLPLYDRDSRRSVRASALLYAAILGKIRKGGYHCLTRRFSLSFTEKLSILLKGFCNEKYLGSSGLTAVCGADGRSRHTTQ